MYSDDTGGFTGWVLAGIGGIISTLMTALVSVIKVRENENAKAILKLEATNVKLETSLQTISDKADKCEADRHQLFTNCKVMECKLDLLEKRVISIDVIGTKHESKEQR
jgi:hypothetical protein